MENQNALAQQLRELGEARKYQEQGNLFLEATRSTLEVVEAVPQKNPIWEKEPPTKGRGINYSVTLKNPRGSYTFDYWGSIHDANMISRAQKAQKAGIYSAEYSAIKDWCEKQAAATVPKAISGNKRAPYDHLPQLWLKNAVDTVKILIKPNAYDILTCLHPMSEDSFEDWCASLGYDSDSRTAERIYNACLEQDRMIRRLFTHDEIEALQEIA